MQNLLNSVKRYLPYVAPVVSFGALMVLLNKTSPLQLGPAGILLVFGLLYIFVASSFYLLSTLAIIVVGYFVPISSQSRRRLYYVSSIVATAPVFLLALNSIGQLELKDFILVILLVGVACFYTLKRTRV